MKDKLVDSTVADKAGNEYRIKRLVTIGGQGSVYEDTTGEYIIKVIRVSEPEKQAELVRRYEWLMGQSIPKETRMVTPIALLEQPHTGYIMKRVRGHEPLMRYMSPEPGAELGEWYNRQTGGLRRRLYLGWLLAQSFSALHLQGLSYCDVSPSNVLVAKHSFSVCIIDPDNVSVSGKSESLVMGTPRYIAPELLKGWFQPNPLSDVYSFAVMLFEMLRLGHPLLGDKVHDGEPELEERALRGEFPYIDHPEDRSNGSTRVLPEELMFTPQLRELFRRSFMDGLHDRLKRPTLRDFRMACLEAAEQTVECASCRATYYFEKERRESACPWCNHVQNRPAYLKFLQRVLAPKEAGLNAAGQTNGFLVLREGGNGLSARHFQSSLGQEKVGTIHNRTDGVYFTNEMQRPVRMTSGAGKSSAVRAGETVPLTPQDILIFQDHTTTSGIAGTKLFLYAQLVKGD